MEFEWDDIKNITNKQKHGIDFSDGKEVFKDQNSKLAPDLRKDYKEDHWKIIGKIYGSIISVIYTVSNNVTNIILARIASSKEIDEYYRK
jgi:hypothetical protein